MAFYINVFSSAAYYAPLALAIIFVYRANRVLLFCVGEIGALAAFVAYSLRDADGAGWSWPSALLGALAVSGLVGAILFFSIERLGKRIDHFVGTMLTIAFSLVLQGVMSLVWQGEIFRYSLPPFFLEIASQRVSGTALNIGATGFAVAFSAVFVLGYSRIGREIEAIADNRVLSVLRSVPVTQRMMSVGIAAGILAGAGGILAGAMTSVSAENAALGVNAIVAAIIGGLTSPGGAVAGAFVLALVENLTTAYLGPAYVPLTPILLLAAMLVFRPYGLFGKAERIQRV